MKCLICGEEIERKKFHFHLRKDHKIKMKEYFVKFNYNFSNENYLKEMYYKKKKSLKEITRIAEEEYGISNLKSFVLDYAKDYNLKLRSVSDANKIFFSKNTVWNKGLTKENSKEVKKYAEKKKELYKQVIEKLESLSIKELLNFNVHQNKKIRRILRNKIIDKQKGVCPICKTKFDKLENRKKHIHHIDRDNSNNKEENLVVLCSSCHMKISGHKWRLLEIDKFDTFEKFIKNSNEIERGIKRIKKNRPTYASYSVYRNVEYLNCEICKNDENVHIHHLDGNPENNTEDNLMFLCRKCHGKVTGFNIIVTDRKTLKEELDEKQKVKYDKNKYIEKNKESGRCSVNISKLKLKEFIQS